jgi:hypothetical protein
VAVGFSAAIVNESRVGMSREPRIFKKIDHVEIVPSDFEESLVFYCDVLGFTAPMVQWISGLLSVRHGALMYYVCAWFFITVLPGRLGLEDAVERRTHWCTIGAKRNPHRSE